MVFELGVVKELLPPSKFPLFGYVVVIFSIVAGVPLAGYSAFLRSREQDKFQCSFVPHATSDKNHEYLLERCYKKYDTKYNSPLPLWGFVLLELTFVLSVCLIYSCCVQSTIARIAPSVLSDAESPRLRQRRTPQRIFRFYTLHLLARFGLTTLFLVLQTSVFFPITFPTEFSCGSPAAKPWNVTNSNTTNTELKPTSSPSNCHTSIAKDKTVASIFLLVLNILYLLLVSIEIIYLVYRAFQNSNFTSDTEFRANYFFNRSSTHAVRNEMKKLFLRQTEKVSLICCEDRRLMDDIFVDRVIHMKKANGELVLINSYEELYLPIENIVTDAPKVLVLGLPGSGKSLLCQKLLRDWSKKTSRDGFDFAFLFKFSWFNSEATDKMSLKELLNRGVCSEGIIGNVFQRMLANPKKILLIFDGLNEFKDSENCTENKEGGFENSSTEKIPVSALYVKLLQDKLLPGATVLTTSRHNVITNYEASLFDRTVEIKQFDEEKVHKYVDNYCKQDEDSKVATSIKEHISATSYFLSLCCIPVYCHIVCNLLRDVIIEESLDGVRLTTVYEKALTFFIFKHHPDHRDNPFPENHEHFSDSVEKALTDLGLLAKRGIFKGRRMFRSEKVANAMRNCGLLKNTRDENGEQCFSFIHPTFQDFLAARGILKMKPALLKKKVIGVLKTVDTDWLLVLQFFMGLLHGQEHEAVSSFANCLHDSLLSSPANGRMAVFSMKCLYEYNNEATMDDLASRLRENSRFNNTINLQKCQVTSSDCKAIVYFLKRFDSLEAVDLSNNSIKKGGCDELSKWLVTGGPKKLDLSNNRIDEQDLMSLLKASKISTKCNLENLNVSCL